MIFKPTKKDLDQLKEQGLNVEQVQVQIDNFKNGFPKSRLDAPATPANGGIRVLGSNEIAHYEKQYHTLSKGKKLIKFVMNYFLKVLS